MYFHAQRRNLEVAVTGDSLITRRLSPYTEPDFLALRDLIRQADVRFTNLEVVLGEGLHYPAEYCGGNWLGVPPGMADELSWMGFNLFSTANNPGGDFGPLGVLSTIKELAARGLAHAGAGESLTKARQPVYMDLDPGRIAMVAATASIPHGHAAGEQRQDMIGRPGVSPLRNELTYNISPSSMKALKAVAQESGIAAAATERSQYRVEKPLPEDEFKLLEAKFRVSDQPGITSEPNARDLEEILKWVRDSRRQADFCFVSLHAHDAQIQIVRPAQYVEKFCRACVDAGADAVFGHGPHILRAIEIYRGKPIFYSLGNFMMQSSTLQHVPPEMYHKYDLDGFDATLADVWDARLQRELIRQKRIYYESALARVSIEGGSLKAIKLYPLHLGTETSRPQQGRPILARGEMAEKILGDLQTLSAPYGTEITIDGGVGIVRLG